MQSLQPKHNSINSLTIGRSIEQTRPACSDAMNYFGWVVAGAVS